MNGRKTVSKKSKKRNSGLIIGFLNFINDFIMNGLTTGFFSKVFSTNSNSERLERESLSLGMSSDTPEGKKKSAKRYIHKRYDVYNDDREGR